MLLDLNFDFDTSRQVKFHEGINSLRRSIEDVDDKLGIPFCIFLGEDEIAANKVSLKNMIDGDQVTCDTEEAIRSIKGFIEPLNEEKPVSLG